MTIQLNGESCHLPTSLTVAGLLEHIGLAGKPVVVELDEKAIFPRDYTATAVNDGARVEIVTLAAGG